jgi:hypothetical protein
MSAFLPKTPPRKPPEKNLFPIPMDISTKSKKNQKS